MKGKILSTAVAVFRDERVNLGDRLFCIAFVQQLGDGMCSLLPYGTGVCRYVLM